MINRKVIASALALGITATGLVACNKTDASAPKSSESMMTSEAMTPSESMMTSEAMMTSEMMAPSESMMMSEEPSEAMEH